MTDDLQKIIKHYGEDAQLIQVIEEMSELTKEITKYYKGADTTEQIKEEMADVLLMFEQLFIMTGISHADVMQIMYQKLQRTMERIK